MSQKPFCCKIDCDKDAEWQIVYGASTDNYTEACTDHVGELLEPAKENTVYPIYWNDPLPPCAIAAHMDDIQGNR